MLGRAVEAYLGFDLGMTYSVLCTEDVPFIDPLESPQDEVEWFFSTSTSHVRSLCSEWPPGSPPDGYHEPVRAGAPVLIISGALDPVIPPSWGEEIASGLANSRHIIVPGASHGPVSSCEMEVTAAFIMNPAPLELDASCLESSEPPDPH